MRALRPTLPAATPSSTINIADKYQLRAVVTAGPQQGATALIDAAETRIGGGNDNDLIIHGTDVPDRIGTLICRGNKFGFVAETDDVRIGRRIAVRGRFEPLASGLVISFHAAQIAFEQTRARRFRVPRSRTVIGVGVAAISAAFAFAFLYPPGAQYGREAVPSNNQPLMASDPMSPQRVILALKQHLVGRGLSKEIALRADQGTVLAAGIIGAGQKTQWLQTQRWLDSVSKNHAPLLDHVQILPSHVPPPVALAAVIRAPKMMIVTVNGTQYAMGATLPKGWHLDRIGNHNVVFSRQGVIVQEHY